MASAILRMVKKRKGPVVPPEEAMFAAKKRKPIPYPFVLDALDEIGPETKPMFGSTAVYVEEKIVLILREKSPPDTDNGVWLATTEEHHASLRNDFPGMRSIQVFGSGVTGWQVLAADAPDFEEATLRACALILKGDPRIGKIPGQRAAKKTTVAKKTTAAKKTTVAKKRSA